MVGLKKLEMYCFPRAFQHLLLSTLLQIKTWYDILRLAKRKKMQKHVGKPQAFKLQETGMKAADKRVPMLLEGVAPSLNVMPN